MLDFLKNKTMKRRFYLSYGVFLLNGALALSIGALLPFIRDARDLDYTFCGILVSLHSLGNLFSSFASGILPTFVGRRKTILFFNAFFAISYVLIAFGNGRWSLILAFLMTGLARGATSNFCNHLINNLAPGKAWVINGLHAMFSVGAFLFPILLTLITYSGEDSWVYGCYFMIAMGALSWILYYLIPDEKSETARKRKDKANFGFFREPFFHLCTATLFFYLCAEQGVIGWLVTYFKDTGLLSDALSQLVSSILWIAILLGRLTTAWLSVKVRKEKLLVVMGSGLVLFFLLLITSKSSGPIVAGILGFGFSMAGIYPTTVSFSGHIIEKYPMSWSFILTLASLGSIIMPSVIGKIAESAGIAYGMSSVALAVIIDLGCIIALSVYAGRRREVE